MSGPNYFWMLTEQVFTPALPITATLAVVLAVLAWRGYRRGLIRPRQLAFATSLLGGPMILLLWGTVREHTNERWAGNLPAWEPWELHVLHGLAILVACLIALFVVRAKEVRLLAGSWALLVAWWTLVAWFVSTMSIGGDWI